jgi:hypothetical protein
VCAGFHLFDDLGERLRRCLGMVHGADRERVGVGTEARRGGEVELRPGCVDEVVVAESSCLTSPRGVGEGDVDCTGRVELVAEGANRNAECLMELDAQALVDGTKREPDPLFVHTADADPDVRGNPVVVRCWRNHDHLVISAECTVEIERGGMAGDSRSHDDDTSHCSSSIRTGLRPWGEDGGVDDVVLRARGHVGSISSDGVRGRRGDDFERAMSCIPGRITPIQISRLEPDVL